MPSHTDKLVFSCKATHHADKVENFSWLTLDRNVGADESEPTKECTKCHQVKRHSEYHKCGRVHDGRRSICKSCMNIYYKNREDKYEVARRTYRENNRALMREKNLRYQSTVPGRASNLWKTAMHRAKMKGIAFDLPREWVIEKLKLGICEITGLEFELTKKKDRNYANPMAPSIDRIDPAKGYTLENSRMVVWGYNSLKACGTDEQVMIIINALFEKRELQCASF